MSVQGWAQSQLSRRGIAPREGKQELPVWEAIGNNTKHPHHLWRQNFFCHRLMISAHSPTTTSQQAQGGLSLLVALAWYFSSKPQMIFITKWNYCFTSTERFETLLVFNVRLPYPNVDAGRSSSGNTGIAQASPFRLYLWVNLPPH